MNATEFQDAHGLFAGKSLELPELIALKPDNQPYCVIAIQPTGLIDVRDDFIGNADQTAANAKFASFFALASDLKAELALAPEYSCPWASISDVVKAQKLPPLGKLWIIGCESITPQKFKQFVAVHPQIVWLHQQPLPEGPGQFYGVLCYLLKTTTRAGAIKDVAIVQFKRQTMSDKAAFERDHLIPGNVTYYLRNSDDTIRLLSLICSESLTFKPANYSQCRIDLHPYLIFHPQLNVEPRHTAIKAYRSGIYTATFGDRTEVIALNWGRGFKLPKSPPSLYGGSTIFMRSDRFFVDDQHLEKNHTHGLYFNKWQSFRSQMCMLNFDEHVFYFRTQKVYSTGDAALFNRTGPEMLQLWSLDPESNKWIKSPAANDGFLASCNAFDEGSFDCCLGNGFPAVSRERLLALSTGKILPSKEWHRVENLRSFLANEDESSNRLIFAQDQQPSAIEFRKSHLERFIKLHKTILADRANYPGPITDLVENCELSPPLPASNYRFNIISKNGKAQGATGIFIGQESPASAKQFRETITAEWGTSHSRRLVVWYEHDNKIKWDCSALPTVTDDSDHPASVTKSGPI